MVVDAAGNVTGKHQHQNFPEGPIGKTLLMGNTSYTWTESGVILDDVFFDQNQAVKGSEEFQVRHRGSLYFFSSGANRDRFNFNLVRSGMGKPQGQICDLW